LIDATGSKFAHSTTDRNVQDGNYITPLRSRESFNNKMHKWEGKS